MKKWKNRNQSDEMEKKVNSGKHMKNKRKGSEKVKGSSGLKG